MAPHFSGVNDDRTDFKYVGVVSQPGRQAYDMAKGVAKYQRDMVKEGMVYARALRCPYGHAKVEILDTSAAEALEGVVAIIPWDDEDMQNYPAGWRENGRVPFLSNQADYAGDECGVVVVARTDELCKEALDLVEVKWTVLPHTVEIRDAAAAGAPLMRPELNDKGNIGGTISGMNVVETGNVAEGFAQADHIIEFDYNYNNYTSFIATPSAYLAFTEADPWGNADYGEMLYVNGGTTVMEHNGAMGQAIDQLGLPMDRIRHTSPYCGGKYCNYAEQRGVGLAPYLAMRLKMPIRYVYDRRDAFNSCDSQARCHLRVGFTNEGRTTAIQLYTLEQTGVGYGTRNGVPVHYPTGGTGLMQQTKCENIYAVMDQILTNATLTVTDAGSRACDLPNLVNDHIAEVLGMDPLDVLRLNIKESALYSLEPCIEVGKKAFNWDEKFHAPGERTLPDGRLHGVSISVSPQSHGQGQRYNMNLALKSDGKVYLPFNEMILGFYWPEMLQLVVAEESGMKLEDVIVYYSPHYPNWYTGSSNDHASSATFAAKDAAAKLKQRMCAKGYKLVGAESPDQVDIVDSMLVLKADPTNAKPLGGLAQVTAFSDENSSFRPTLDEMACTNIDFCEVAVDPETGDVEILDFVMTHDFGKMFRPSSAIGQIELHAIMLTGMTKMEEVVFDNNTGVLLNGNIIDYKVPTRLDMTPLDFHSLESRNGYGAYGSVSNGHSHLNRNIVVAAVANAIGAWVDNVPLTSNRVLRALGKIK